MFADTVAKLWNDLINPVIYDLIHRNFAHERLGGLILIDSLIQHAGQYRDSDSLNLQGNSFRLYNYAKSLIPSRDVGVMIAASNTMGRIVEAGDASFGDHFVDYEVAKALAWVEGHEELEKYAGVLTLRVLARYCSTHLSSYVHIILDKIWITLRDLKPSIRETSAEVLAMCLDILKKSERSEASARVHSKLLREAMAGAKQSDVATLEGSLLAVQELFSQGGMYMKPHFAEVGDTLLQFKNHKEAQVRKSTMALIPILATYDPEKFSHLYLQRSMTYLQGQLKRPDRDQAFTAIGNVAFAVRSDMKPFLDLVLISIKDALQQKRKESLTSDDAIFSCLAKLAEAVGPYLATALQGLLDLILSCVLSKAMLMALNAMSTHIQLLLQPIQDRLLRLLCPLLSGLQYKPCGRPNSGLPSDCIEVVGIPTAKDPEGLMLALGALSDFDFSGEYRHVLTDIMRACTLRYLDHDTPGVRKAAVHALCKLLARDSCRKDCAEDEIVERLVALAVTDSDPSVRLASLISLDRDFDTHLAQEKVMSSLSLVLNDEVYINREQAMRIFARLVDLNPEHVIPPIRRALMDLSTELGHCTAVRSQTESVKLLTILIAASSRLIKPHVSSLTAVLVTRSWAQDVTVASGSLRCLGELATVAGTMLVDHLPEIMALLTKTLQPPSHIRKQDAAVFALGQVCSNSGYVIDPLLDHPSLWGLLSGTLKEDGSVFGKRSVVKSLGILGALNPSEREASNINCYRLSEPIRKSKAHGIEEVLKPNGPPSEEYFRAVVICELLKILRNNSLSPIHHFVIEAVMTLFKAQSAQFASYLPQILPSFFDVIRNSGPRMREFYLQQLAILIQIVGRSIRNHSKDIVDLVHELQISSQLGAHVVALVESLVRALNAEFSPFLPTVLPQMLQLLEGPIDKKTAVLLRVFQVLQALGPNVEEYLQLIIPPTLRVIEHRNVPSTLRLSALWTIDSLSRRVDLANDASRILHALTRALDHGDLEWRNEVLNTLCVFVVMFGSRYGTFIKMVHKSSLAHSLEGALASSSVPAEVIRILLNLAEFMEREIQPLPINLKVMRECAITYHSYAKALHYTETQYFSDPNSTPIIEALINIHKNLQQDDAAWGILTVARIRNLVTRQEEWYEKLGRWGDALEGYDQRLTLEADDVGAISGRLRCLQALGEWEDLSISTQGLWIAATNAERQRIAPVAAAAAWFLGQWHLIEDYIRSMKRGSADRHFYGAILAVHRSQDEVAAELIHKTRDFLSEELATLRMESYEQSYSIVVRVQMLAELEEAMVYKTYRSKNQAEKMDTMRKMWRKRLEGCKPDIDTWQRILQIRRLALEPEEDRIMWTKLANMCRKQGKMTLANKAINALISKTGRKEISDSLTGLFCAQPTTPTSPSLDLTVLYAHLKYTWAIGKRSESLAWMSSLSERLAVEIEHYPANTNNPTQDTLSIEDMRKLLARCLVKRGQWQQALTVSWSMGALHSILTTYALATELDPSRYKAWNTWALANYQVITILERESGMEDVAAVSCVGYVASAIRGFFESISLRPGGSFQDTLRLLTLWFKFGSHPTLLQTIQGGVSRVPIDTWLKMIARIQTPFIDLRRLITRLLTDSTTELRVRVARSIMDHLREHSPIIVNEATVVSNELIRAASLWVEKWHEALEQTLSRYLSDKNLEAMIASLTPIHDELEQAIQLGDIARKLTRSNQVFRWASQQLPEITTLTLNEVSSKLSNARSLELAVPGHDDLRQDERVMQLFGLVNKLLARDANSSKRHLYIQRCSIIPLAPNVGLIGWVYDTDTIHALVQEYRENHSIRTDIEYHLIKDMAPDYEDLCIMQKVESLEYALQRTTGQDLYTILWQKSANSEEWVNRRSTYTRSLAVNSMAGYILGLGDRHPSNILLSRITGQVVHIDFGDCFDVAMMREMYAEKIPFRLTRMLTNAMEVCGVHGTYKIACEISMTILRDNGESLLAVLETFVWDPLLSWRLIQDREDQQGRPHQNRAGAAARVPIRRRLDENAIFNERTNGPSVVDQKRNTKALEALKRVEDKLNGRVDFFNRHAEPRSLPVEAQVETLMAQAMSVENLAQCFHGWRVEQKK
ncbi:phosphatidylinositol kinase- protein kinase tor1 [Tulasnella sp. 330]|nr:phosphatidylinositol kinase- protein kinase tor1 [Tulasnella sp. 330]